MLYRKQEIVELSEKKFTVESLTRLYEEERIYYPQVIVRKMAYKGDLASLIRAIQLGIPMPMIFASELQNGDFLILEGGDQLQYLLRYIMGDFSINNIEGLPRKNDGYFFRELAVQNSRLAGTILRTVFIFQIIDYRTPKYLHMEVGMFHGKWNKEREQAVRNALYKESEMLSDISEKAACYIHNKNHLEDEYTMLYIMLFWGVYKDELQVNVDMCEQELLDAVITQLSDMRYFWLDFMEVVSSCSQYFIKYCRRGSYFVPERDTKYKEKVLGLLVCFYDMCQYTHRNTDKLLCEIFEFKDFLYRIRMMNISVRDIDELIFYGRDLIR